MKGFELRAIVQNYDGLGYIGWIPNIRGLIVQSDTIEDTLNELIKSTIVKIAYDYNFSLVSSDKLEKLAYTYEELFSFDSPQKSYRITF